MVGASVTSTLCSTCPSFPTAVETHISSGMMDDLDLVDSVFLVTVLSRAGFGSQDSKWRGAAASERGHAGAGISRGGGGLHAPERHVP
jgi:hypothetical protein